jgi:hypothetical protein
MVPSRASINQQFFRTHTPAFSCLKHVQSSWVTNCVKEMLVPGKREQMKREDVTVWASHTGGSPFKSRLDYRQFRQLILRFSRFLQEKQRQYLEHQTADETERFRRVCASHTGGFLILILADLPTIATVFRSFPRSLQEKQRQYHEHRRRMNQRSFHRVCFTLGRFNVKMLAELPTIPAVSSEFALVSPREAKTVP